MAKHLDHIFEYNGVRVPLKIYKEWRSSTRISMASKFIILRVPKVLPGPILRQEIRRSEEWCKAQFLNKPSLLDRYRLKEYRTGDQFRVFGKVYTLSLHPAKRKTVSAKVKGDALVVSYPEDTDEDSLSSLSNIISRTLAKAVFHEFSELVHQINRNHFGEYINDIRLKYNRSNWGSCSSNNNLNFSTRLLLAPLDVITYVIVHELAHLKELNHSSRFWNIVESVMPDYQKKEEWLKKFGHSCDF